MGRSRRCQRLPGAETFYLAGDTVSDLADLFICHVCLGRLPTNAHHLRYVVHMFRYVGANVVHADGGDLQVVAIGEDLGE
jgi:hypothetical protein